MKQLIPALFAVGAVMLLAGAAVYITGWPLSPYIYTIGATMVALAQINSPSKCKSPTVKRLRRQQYSVRFCWCLRGHSCSLQGAMNGLCL